MRKENSPHEIQYLSNRNNEHEALNIPAPSYLQSFLWTDSIAGSNNEQQ